MYLDCFNNNGIPYLRIMENYTVTIDGVKKKKKVTIRNLGPLAKFDDGQPNFVGRMREQLANGELRLEGIDPNDFKRRDKLAAYSESYIDRNGNYLDLKNIGYFFIEAWYKKLGINEVLSMAKSKSMLEYDLNGLTKLMVISRVLCPKSKKATFEHRDRYLFGVTSSQDINEIYRSLDVLDEVSSAIQSRMNTRITQSKIGRKTTLTFYDVTNYYFETEFNDKDIYYYDEKGEILTDDKNKPLVKKAGLRKRGVGKDGKNNPLVAMGLFIDQNGIPVAYDIFPGNTQDKTTFKEMIKTALKRQKLGKVIVVADNGNSSQENKYLLVSGGNGYIISKSVKKSWTAKSQIVEGRTIRDWALDESDYICEFNKWKEIVFKYKSRICERICKDSSGNEVTFQEKEVLFWSKKQYERELHKKEEFQEYLTNVSNNPEKLKDKNRKVMEYVKVLHTDRKTGEILHTKQVVILNDQKLEADFEVMGFYSIVSSEIDLDAREIIDKYHGLSRIEDSFRIIKSDLDGQPVYVYKPEHINAHFLLCFIALTIVRLIQYTVLKYQNESTENERGWKQGITTDTLKKVLNNFQADQSNKPFYKTTKPDADLILIAKAAGVDLDLYLPNAADLKKFKSMLYSSW